MEAAALLQFASTNTSQLSSWLRRGVAAFLDTCLIFPLYMVFAAIGGGIGGTTGVSVFLLGLLTVPTYFAIGNGSRRGQTLDKLAVGIAVRRESGERVGYLRALGRYAAMLLIGLVPILGLFALFRPLWDPKNRAFHDDVAKTLVYRAR